MSTSTLRTARRAAAATGGVLALGLGAGSAQAAAQTLTMAPLPGSAELVQKLYVPVPVTISCEQGSDPFGSYYQGTVTIRQVVHRQVAHGQGFFSGTCDGSARTTTIDVFPDPAYGGSPPSAPFKKGAATISGSASTWAGGFASQRPQEIRLR